MAVLPGFTVPTCIQRLHERGHVGVGRADIGRATGLLHGLVGVRRVQFQEIELVELAFQLFQLLSDARLTRRSTTPEHLNGRKMRKDWPVNRDDCVSQAGRGDSEAVALSYPDRKSTRLNSSH